LIGRRTRNASVYLNELDDADQFIEIYDRDLPQMRGAKSRS